MRTDPDDLSAREPGQWPEDTMTFAITCSRTRTACSSSTAPPSGVRKRGQDRGRSRGSIRDAIRECLAVRRELGVPQAIQVRQLEIPA
jgi:hypothetical protein